MYDSDFEITEGRVYPGWQKAFEASILSITAGGLYLLVSIPFPRNQDLDDFRNLTEYGVFLDEYPLIIWKFGKNFLLPAPCNPEFEKQEDPEETAAFFDGGHTDFSRVMIDAHGIVRAACQTSLRPEFIQKMCELWTDESINWKNYNQRLQSIFQTPTNVLWEQSTRFFF